MLPNTRANELLDCLRLAGRDDVRGEIRARRARNHLLRARPGGEPGQRANEPVERTEIPGSRRTSLA
jgi:hypothetical protein